MRSIIPAFVGSASLITKDSKPIYPKIDLKCITPCLLIILGLSGSIAFTAEHDQPEDFFVHNTSHVNHENYSSYTKDWEDEPFTSATGPQTVILWGPEEFPNLVCSVTNITVTKEKKEVDHVTVNAGFEITSEIRASAGNSLLGKIQVDASATLNGGAGWARTGELTMTVKQEKEQPGCTVYYHETNATENPTNGEIHYYVCRFVCDDDPNEPFIYYCGKGTLVGDGRGHTQISRPWTGHSTDEGTECPCS